MQRTKLEMRFCFLGKRRKRVFVSLVSFFFWEIKSVGIFFLYNASVCSLPYLSRINANYLGTILFSCIFFAISLLIAYIVAPSVFAICSCFCVNGPTFSYVHILCCTLDTVTLHLLLSGCFFQLAISVSPTLCMNGNMNGNKYIALSWLSI